MLVYSPGCNDMIGCMSTPCARPYDNGACIRSPDMVAAASVKRVSEQVGYWKDTCVKCEARSYKIWNPACGLPLALYIYAIVS